MTQPHLVPDPEPVEERILRLAGQLDASHAAERHTRLSLLRIHAWMSAAVGVAMMCTGTAQIFEQQVGTWSRPALGSLALVAGMLLAYGIHGPNGRHFGLEAAGLILVGLWDFAMAAGFIVSLFLYGSVVVRWPWDLGPIDLGQPRPYGPVVYFGLMAMVSTVHLAAVLRDRRSARA